jgi:membrane-bound lytic murein transglycosylase A
MISIYRTVLAGILTHGFQMTFSFAKVRLMSLAGWLILIGLIASCAEPKPSGVDLEPVEPIAPKPATEVSVSPLAPVSWADVEGWLDDDPSLVLEAFQRSCRSLRWREEWQVVCARATELSGMSEAAIRAYFEDNFVPHQMRQPNGETEGLLTGYYVPDLRGSRNPSPAYPYALYKRPEDLLTIDLSEIYPDLNHYRLRGRLDGNKVIPYWDREQINSEGQPLAGQELFWVSDPVELFFLHVQGSGRIIFDDGSSVMVNYADQNGHRYHSVGQYLLDQGIMQPHEMSMQNIRAWARRNPDQVDTLLNQNPSYVFFRELAQDVTSPPGAQGVALTPGRSLAVDPRYIPLGTPVFLNTYWPGTDQPLNRLMVAQDTGGAIKGPVRGDFFWGMGDQAGHQAGRMKQAVRMWILLPKGSEQLP